MSEIYKVKQGDYLVKIAKEHGFSDYRRIYDHDKNKKFRKKRPTPNLIYPGDKIYIPDKELKEKSCQTGLKHIFTLQRPKSLVHIALKNIGGEPLSITKYELKTKSKTYTRSISGGDNEIKDNLSRGVIYEKVNTNEGEGELKIWLDDEDNEPDYTYTIKIGYLDPIKETTGIQSRLNNLGFDCGKVDGIKGPKTKEAVKNFQQKYGLKMDGVPGKRSQGKLKEIYGC